MNSWTGRAQGQRLLCRGGLWHTSLQVGGAPRRCWPRDARKMVWIFSLKLSIIIVPVERSWLKQTSSDFSSLIHCCLFWKPPAFFLILNKGWKFIFTPTQSCKYPWVLVRLLIKTWVNWKKIRLYLFFNWTIIALQCCAGFCHTTMCTSHNYTYMPSLFRPSSLQDYTFKVSDSLQKAKAKNARHQNCVKLGYSKPR